MKKQKSLPSVSLLRRGTRSTIALRIISRARLSIPATLERIKGRLLFLSLFFSLSTVAQTNIPTTVTGPVSKTARPLPGVPTAAPDYVRTLMPLMPVTDTAKVRFAAPIDSMAITTQYADGLGRPLETVMKQASPLKKDYVVPATYDDLGRQPISYLPYVSTGNNGQFNTSPFQADSTFYKGAFPNEQINYSMATYDGSPMNRVVKATAPGNSWTGAGVGVSYSMRANTTADSVRLWMIGIVNEDDVPSTASVYSAGSLIVQQTIDERGIKTVAYKDELGRTVLTKQQVAASPSTGHYGWLCTYFVYDEMSHLRIVIPPKAVDTLNTSAANWNLSTNPTIKTGLCFSYFYDALGRVTMKYIPGKGKNYFAYDLFDRIVMTQDANLRQTNQWAFVKYDGQSRPFRSGVITSGLVKDSIIAQAARSLDYPTLTGTYTITSETYFDDYSWISGSVPNSTLVTTYINSTNFNTSYNTAPDYAQQIAQSSRIRGAITGSKKLILNTATYLYTVPLYDDHGRVIQIKQTNYTGGTDVATGQYSFTGRTLRTHLYQLKSGPNTQTHTLLTKYSYDAEGHLKSLIKNIDSQGDKTVSQENYNELGQLQQKIYGASLETQNYTYNLRGWLTSINKSYTDTYNSAANYFGEDIFYDYGFTNSQVNGAIAGVKWKAAGDTIARAYGFSYDNANRLTIADFSQNIRNTSTWTNATVNFSASNLTYDGGGNIFSMSQRGLTIGNSAIIDSLKYQYYTNSNQLQKVSDAAAYTSVGLGDFRDTALATDDYSYDVNGNITKDYNRKMHTPPGGNGAVYNLLDKPDSLVISGKATLYYYYDAGGNTLKKQIKDYTTGTTNTYLYVNGFVYLNDTLQYAQMEDGRIRWAKKRNSISGSTYYAFEYDYYLRDHLGNVRTVLTEGKDTATYAATMETADSAVVQALFSNVYDPVRTVTSKPANFDTVGNNHNVSVLSGSTGGRIGPSMVLKVMAGDKVQISTFAFYNTATQPPVTDNTLLNDLLSTLVSGVTAQSGGKIGSGNTTAVSNAVSPAVLSFLNSRTYNSSLPKAYLNWVLLDDQFKYVAGNMGAMQVMAGSSKQALVAPLQTIAKNGYLYIYVSNQSPQNVYFDDLIIKHYTGPLLQEQSYYPFGLEMAGISDKALGKLDSKNKFNGGSEIEEDFGVNLYSTFYRQYDPQIGRFSGVDALSEENFEQNPYEFAFNDPIYWNDPSGLLSDAQHEITLDEIIITGLVVLDEVRINRIPTASGIDQFDWNNLLDRFSPNNNGGGFSGDADSFGNKANSGGNSPGPGNKRNPAQDKKLSDSQIKALKKLGWKHRDKNQGSHGGQVDVYYDPKTGQMYEKPKGSGRDVEGEAIDYNFKDLNNFSSTYMDNYIAGLSPGLSISPSAAQTTTNVLKDAGTAYLTLKGIEIGVTFISGGSFSWTLAF